MCAARSRVASGPHPGCGAHLFDGGQLFGEGGAVFTRVLVGLERDQCGAQSARHLQKGNTVSHRTSSTSSTRPSAHHSNGRRAVVPGNLEAASSLPERAFDVNRKSLSLKGFRRQRWLADVERAAQAEV